MRKNRHGWYNVDDFVTKDARFFIGKGEFRQKYGDTPREGIHKTSSLRVSSEDIKRNFFRIPQTYSYSFWKNNKNYVSLHYETKHNRF